MGGPGSGNRWRYGAKSTTDDYRILDVRRWAREGVLRPGYWGGWVRRETGRRLKVQVLYGEGLASHTGPESCVAVREDRCEALTGECVGQPLSGENQLRGADVLRPSEGDTACVDSARRSPTPRRRRTWHAQNPSVREPGDLQAVRGGHCTDRVGKAGGHSRR